MQYALEMGGVRKIPKLAPDLVSLQILRLRIRLCAHLCHAFTYILYTLYLSFLIRLFPEISNPAPDPKNVAGVRNRLRAHLWYAFIRFTEEFWVGN